MTAPDVNADVRARFESHAKAASKAEAHLYAWATVEAILTSGATPDRQDATARKQVERVLKICRDECRRLLVIHDTHMAAALAKFHPTHQEKP